MTFAGGVGLEVKATRRFLDDHAKLSEPVARRVAEVVRIIREHGTRYPGLETRKIARIPDSRYA